jgi:hypothetical protein
MKKIVIVASFALLASCGAKKDTAAEAPATDAAATAAATTAAVAAPAPGSYDVTNPDGSKGVTTLMADGTYVDRDGAGKVTAKGKWTHADSKTCFTPETGAAECYTETAPAADGSFTATDSKGAVTQVKPHVK